ncbi:hypothetical protein TRAPUB_6211 [Trametes pubescens]|uniref:F-box domain-containing protein n=1 Tax=Trametes pubescens TaxID=154538 RepID=A0A1M2V6K3_TRAPU|nr:hypothetical protein TRAPUB_6211 [Trametes pubescens]
MSSTEFRRMAPTAINDDVLLHILSYLHGRDALHVALCSKYLYHLAQPRINAVVVCDSPKDLRTLHSYMFSVSPPRSHDLENFEITLLTFDYPESANIDFSDYWEFSQVPLIGDILMHAPRLKHLCLERLHPCLAADARIAPALAALERLESADFATVSDWTWMCMAAPLSACLRSLRLSYFWHEDDDLQSEGESKTLPPLLHALAPLHNLHTLELWNFDPPPSGCPLPAFPSIRDLRMGAASPSALELVECCPNLSILEFSLLHDGSNPNYLPLRDGPRWPPLHRLALFGHTEIGTVLDRVGTANIVRIANPGLTFRSDGANQTQVTNLLALLQHTSPISLSLPVGVEETPGMTFWAQVPALAPRLRILDLRITFAALSLENRRRLYNIQDTLRPLSIVYLSISMSKAPPTPGWAVGDEMEIDPEPVQEDCGDATQVEEYLTSSMVELPGRVAAAIPSLRFVTIASARKANPGILSKSSTELDPDPVRIPPSSASSTQLSVGNHISTRYWQVINQGENGSSRGLLELPASEGERIRNLADDAIRFVNTV